LGCAGIVGAVVLELLYLRHNKRYENTREDDAVELLGREELERMGDKSPLFRYSL
jgi:hypothetical protein